MKELLSHGARAGRSGRYGETTIEGSFHVYGVPSVEDNRAYHADTDFLQRKDKLLVRQYRLLSGRRVDFFYKDFANNLNVPIECKQQMNSGTTDEKLAYTIDQLAACGFHYFWLVLGGGGFNPAVTAFIETKVRKINQLGKVKGRIIHNAGNLLQKAIERLVERNEP
jgi:PD-(D/E)XK nuclease superfamily domain